MTPNISQIGLKVALTVAALCLVTGTSTAQLSKKGPPKDPCVDIYPRTSPGVPVSCDLTGRIDLPVDQWLSQGERSEIPWKVSLSN
ncbi:MAG TPA: hypothetical protein VFA71_05895, partial [Terriglobales bacterium]|nr:hypothetical protein [Terriglobales bacterium]